jgi:hypothetical protein
MKASPVTRCQFAWSLGQALAATCLGARAIEAVRSAQRAGGVMYTGEQQGDFQDESRKRDGFTPRTGGTSSPLRDRSCGQAGWRDYDHQLRTARK